MKLTYLKNGGILMTLNMGGKIYKEIFVNEDELKNFCDYVDKNILKVS